MQRGIQLRRRLLLRWLLRGLRNVGCMVGDWLFCAQCAVGGEWGQERGAGGCDTNAGGGGGLWCWNWHGGRSSERRGAGIGQLRLQWTLLLVSTG